MYKIVFQKTAEKNLAKIPKLDKLKIQKCIDGLSKNPFPNNSTQLVGENNYRLRIGNYRVVYFVHNTDVLIIIIDIDHRKDIYK